MRKHVLLAIPILALVIAGIGLNMYNHPENTAGITVVPTLRVYKDGVLVYEKRGDPPTYNLVHLFFAVIAPRYYTSGNEFKVTVSKMDGNGYTLNPDYNYNCKSGVEQAHSGWVIAGTGQNAPSPADTSMQMASYGEAKVVDYKQLDNKTWVIIVSGSITFSGEYNITEIGYSADIDGTSVESPPGNNLLLFRDMLSTPIHVKNGDSITVQYEIRISLP